MPAEIREGRLIYGTTFNTSYTAASAAGWNPGTAHLFQGWWDDSKLKRPGIRKKHLVQRHHGTPGFAAGREDSELPISMYVGLASTTLITPPWEATLLSKIFGGITNPPSTRTIAVGGGTSSSTRIYSTGHGLTAGQGVLIAATGEARRIGAVSTDYFDLEMALSATPADSSLIVIANTVYCDPTATMQYIDTLLTGYHAEDQLQTLGCMGPVTFDGIMHDAPVDFTINLTVPRWQEVPVADRETAPLSYASVPENSGTAPTLGDGGVYFGDWGVTTRALLDCDDVKVDPGLAFVTKRSGGVITGFKRSRGISKLSFKQYVDADYGIHADFTSQTEKQALVQFGNSAGNCFWISLPRLKPSNKPVRATVNDMRALECEFEALEPTVASTPVELYSSMCSLNWA